ncbi:MAG: tetratricopeptide repeat protein [Candidatus Saganbacteria bacterium]|nr:tetratricopeptide repeat protein [Candidatus Saganbacteria bacterium]
MDEQFLDVLFEAGKDVYQEGCYDGAIEIFKMVLEKAPKDRDAMLWLGLCRLSAGDNKEAIYWFKESLKAHQYYFDPHNYLYMGLSFIHLGDVAKGVICSMFGAVLLLNCIERDGRQDICDFVDMLNTLIDDGYNEYRIVKCAVLCAGKTDDIRPIVKLISSMYGDIPMPRCKTD